MDPRVPEDIRNQPWESELGLEFAEFFSLSADDFGGKRKAPGMVWGATLSFTDIVQVDDDGDLHEADIDRGIEMEQAPTQ